MGMTHDTEHGGSTPLHADEQNWYAVHTYPQNEKKVATELQRRGITTFLPLREERHRWTDRNKVVQLPLFPCYAFVRMHDSDCLRHAVATTPRVIRLLPDNNEPSPVPDSEVESIRTLLQTNVPYLPFSLRSAVGKKVRIRSGSLDGVEGTLVNTTRGGWLVISVNLIDKSIAITLDGYDIEPI